MTLTFGSPEARDVIESDRQAEQELQAAPAKVVELGARLDALAEEAARFELIHLELDTAIAALSSDPWLAKPLAMLKSYHERAGLKGSELEAAYTETAEELDHYAALLDEVTE